MFENTLFRCSSLGKLMTDPRSKSETLSETTKTHLVEVYVREVHGREKEITTKYMEKGLSVEEDSITLYSRFNKKFYSKNEERLKNSFVIGTPDLFEGDSIETASHIIDIKSSWDIFTFYAVRGTAINKNYYWQLQGYMDLTGAKTATLAYCLVNTPDTLIEDEKRKLQWKMGIIDPTGNDLYEEACAKIEKSMIFDDVPLERRVFEFKIERNDEDIMRMHKRVEECRQWLQQFDAGILNELKAA